MQSLDDYIAEQVAADPTFAIELKKAEQQAEFAIQLARARELRQLTQRDLSKLTGIKQPQLARIEKGQVPTLATLGKLAGALGVTFEIRGASKTVSGAAHGAEHAAVQVMVKMIGPKQVKKVRIGPRHPKGQRLTARTAAPDGSRKLATAR